MVSHAIKIFSVSKKPDGKVVNTRIFYALGQATSIPMCFSPLPIHKRSVFFFWSNKVFFFFSAFLSPIYGFSTPLSLLYHHMSEGKKVEFLPEALKASSVEQIGSSLWSRWVDNRVHSGDIGMTLTCFGYRWVTSLTFVVRKKKKRTNLDILTLNII